jgi:hypothetical protein
MLPIDIIVEIGILAGPDEYEQLSKTSKRNAIILQKPYIIKATNALIVKVQTIFWVEFQYDGKCHSFNDQPAIINLHGDKDWYQHGNLHRDNDQPASIRSIGGKREWYQHGERHRDNDNPAVVWDFGRREWYQRGRVYRISSLQTE